MQDAVRASFARLLAAENLTVSFSAHARTAAFHMGSRVLVLPRWKTENPDVFTMLVAHEVGHALFTPRMTNSGFDANVREIAAKADRPEMMAEAKGCWNVVEDARIERLMVRKFPGLRRSFASAYESLREEFFGDTLRLAAADAASFVDRVNVHFKLSWMQRPALVPFTAAEAEIVRRIGETESHEQVVGLSVEVLKTVRAEAAATASPRAGNIISGVTAFGDEEDEDEVEKDEAEAEEEDTAEEEPEEVEEETEEIEEPQIEEPQVEEPQVEEPQSTEGVVDAPEAEAEEDESEEEAEEEAEEDEAEAGESGFSIATTDMMDRIGDKMLADAPVESKSEVAIKVDIPASNLNNVLMDNQKFLALAWNTIDTQSQASSEFRTKLANARKSIAKHLAAISRSVGPMVSKFLALAAADIDRRTSSHQSGSLDPARLSEYRTSDDLFTRHTTVRDGVNHGLFVLMDWSGSMSGSLFGCIDQLAILTMFCRKLQIPFEVQAFTDAGLYRVDPAEQWQGPQPTNKMCRLMSILSSKSSDANYRKSLEWLYMYTRSEASHRENHPLSRMVKLDRRSCYPLELSLNGTPLAPAIIHSIDSLRRFQSVNRVARTHFVVLSDGDGSSMGLLGVDVETGEVVDNRVWDSAELTKDGRTVTLDGNEDTESSLIRLLRMCTVGVTTTLIHIGDRPEDLFPWLTSENKAAVVTAFGSGRWNPMFSNNPGFMEFKGSGVFGSMFLLNRHKPLITSPSAGDPDSFTADAVARRESMTLFGILGRHFA